MCFQKGKGATLLEVMLVLAISGTMIMVGIKMYRSYQMTAQIQQLQYNVDQLFQALGHYYQANCATGDFSPNPPNFLSPYSSSSSGITYPPATTAYYPVSISSVLLAKGYLDNWYPSNVFVDPSGSDSGYIVQLNPKTMTDIPVNACVVLTTGIACVPSPAVTYPPQSTIPASQAEIVYWELQVAVKINNSSDIQAYLPALGADCISGQTENSSPVTVDPCPSTNANKEYIVWMRAPSFATIQKNSSFSTMMPLLKRFNLQYTHDPNYEFNMGYSSTTTPAQAPVYYQCGG